MNDHEIRKLLAKAEWRLSYTFQDGSEEYTGKADTEAPGLDDIRRLLQEYDAYLIALNVGRES